MRLLRGMAWFIVVLTVASAIGSVVTDPYFDRFADRPDLTMLESDGETRPVWRIPAVVPPIFVDAVAFRLLTSVPPIAAATIAPRPRAPFVPPRV